MVMSLFSGALQLPAEALHLLTVHGDALVPSQKSACTDNGAVYIMVQFVAMQDQPQLLICMMASTAWAEWLGRHEPRGIPVPELWLQA